MDDDIQPTEETPENGAEAAGEAAASKRRFRKAPPGELVAPTFGYVPGQSPAPAPTLAEPGGPDATAYEQAVERLRASTTGDLLLIAGVGAAAGVAATALNLAIAAARLGLRVVLVDANPDGAGATRYLRTGTGPGLAELAAGQADLREASRLLVVGEQRRLPVIPTGADLGEAELDTTGLADAIDRLTEHSDLVLVGVPSTGPDSQLSALAAHADGSVLAVGGRGAKRASPQAAARLEAAGAPVIGIVEQAAERRRSRRSRR